MCSGNVQSFICPQADKQCNRNLSLSNYSAYKGIFYCKPHFLSVFKTNGGKYDPLNKTAQVESVIKVSEKKIEQDQVEAKIQLNLKEIEDVIQEGNMQKLQDLVESRGAELFFEAIQGAESAVEFAFMKGNVEMARWMIQKIQNSLKV